MQSEMMRSTHVARTSLIILIAGILLFLVCFALFALDTQKPWLLGTGICGFIISVVIEVLLMRKAKNMFLSHYSRVGMRNKKVKQP